MNDEQVQEQDLVENEDIVLAEQFEQQVRNMCLTDQMRSSL